MSNVKKRVRLAFREAVFQRDGHRCKGCGIPARVGGVDAELSLVYLDAHHITDRGLMPNGGYVMENGISLCPDCHEKAEVFHSTGTALPGWSPDDLYTLVGSSHAAAKKASEALG